MKRRYSYCAVLVLVLTLLVPSTVFASYNEEDTEYTILYDYEINSYSVNVIVNEDNSMDITEILGVNFNEPKHGIYRKLPMKNQVERLDGSTSRNSARISDVIVDNEFTTSTEDGYYVIKIGSADTTVTGFQEYTIQYHYDIGRDPSKNFDEFYYNLIGTEWDTIIEYVDFSIVMPKEFDEENLGFSVGRAGSTDSEDISFYVYDNTIEGCYFDTLSPGEGLTVRLELPEGYFISGTGTFDFKDILMFVIPGVCLLISFVLWRIYGKDDKPVETVEFYPPEGFNSLEIGFLYKGKAEKEDVVSLLVYLANKGYLSIMETEEKVMFSAKKGFQLTKLKEYDGDNECERIFFNELFTTPTVTSSELNLKFYTTVDKILSKINDTKNRKKISQRNILQRALVVIGILLSLVVTVSIPTLEYASVNAIAPTLFIILAYSPFYLTVIFGKMNKFVRLFIGIFVVVHSFVFFSTLPLIDAMRYEPLYFVGVLFGVICLAGMVMFFRLMEKRTPYGTKILGQIQGFKNFLETAEKDRLEAMVMENSSYFYDILPYTYVLGVSDTWIKKFESIALEEPGWYHSPTGFHVAIFGSFMNQTMQTANRTMTSHPSSSSGGSGGGHSGGGSGGGGGGSW